MNPIGVDIVSVAKVTIHSLRVDRGSALLRFEDVTDATATNLDLHNAHGPKGGQCVLVETSRRVTVEDFSCRNDETAWPVLLLIQRQISPESVALELVDDGRLHLDDISCGNRRPPTDHRSGWLQYGAS